jgi:hypothetical protein
LPTGRIGAKVTQLVIEDTLLGHLAEIDDLSEHKGLPTVEASGIRFVCSSGLLL